MTKKQSKSTNISIPQKDIENKILLMRGTKVMMDHDLAKLYGVATGNLNKAVRRNIDRFPGDFMFQLNQNETESLRFHFGSSKQGRGGRRYLPYVFTQEGVAMLSSVLNSERAIIVNIQIMRAFVKLRELMLSHKDLAQKIDNLEHKFKEHDKNFVIVFDAIKKLLAPPVKPKGRIGFHAS
jgi:phage regulator Rha-like protein